MLKKVFLPLFCLSFLVLITLQIIDYYFSYQEGFSRLYNYYGHGYHIFSIIFSILSVSVIVYSAFNIHKLAKNVSIKIISIMWLFLMVGNIIMPPYSYIYNTMHSVNNLGGFYVKSALLILSIFSFYVLFISVPVLFYLLFKASLSESRTSKPRSGFLKIFKKLSSSIDSSSGKLAKYILHINNFVALFMSIFISISSAYSTLALLFN